MKEKFCPEWDPKPESVLGDQITSYDQLRQRCPGAGFSPGKQCKSCDASAVCSHREHELPERSCIDGDLHFIGCSGL